jgi:ankyrin repeat protein
MLRSCLVLLACYAALFAGYVWWLGQMFDPPGLYIGAAVVALIAGGGLGALYNSRVAYREWSLVAAARQGLPWSDGRWTAIVGDIHPVSEPLQAPFSGEECVLCEYDVASQHRVASASSNENSKPGSDFAGFLMNPCVVRGQAGELRLLGFPNLVGWGERVCNSGQAVANAEAFLTGSEFEDFSGLKLVTVFSAIKAAWSDDDGLVRKNLRIGKTTPQALFPSGTEPAASGREDQEYAEEPDDDDDEADGEDIAEEDEDALDADAPAAPRNIPLLKEKRVKVGEHVCAIGIYSGARGGLVPGGLGADHFIKLIRGRGADVERQARGSVFGRFFGGLVTLVLVHAVAVGVMLAARYDSRQRDDRQSAAFKIIRSQQPDLARLAKLIGRGVDVNGRDGQGQTLLGAAREPAAARWLIAHGADVNMLNSNGRTPLMEAARRGDQELVKVLLEAKALVDLPSVSDGNATALSFAERAGNLEVANLLRQAGATDVPVVAEQLPVVEK